MEREFEDRRTCRPDRLPHVVPEIGSGMPEERRIEGFALTGHLDGRLVQASLTSGMLTASSAWLQPAREMVAGGVHFERDGRWFRATLDGDPLSVFVTLLRCPVRIRSASLSFERDLVASAALQ